MELENLNSKKVHQGPLEGVSLKIVDCPTLLNVINHFTNICLIYSRPLSMRPRSGFRPLGSWTSSLKVIFLSLPVCLSVCLSVCLPCCMSFSPLTQSHSLGCTKSIIFSLPDDYGTLSLFLHSLSLSVCLSPLSLSLFSILWSLFLSVSLTLSLSLFL